MATRASPNNHELTQALKLRQGFSRGFPFKSASYAEEYWVPSMVMELPFSASWSIQSVPGKGTVCVWNTRKKRCEETKSEEVWKSRSKSPEEKGDFWLSSPANTAKHQSIYHNLLDADEETTCSSEEKLVLEFRAPPRTTTAQQHNTRRAAMELFRLVIAIMVSSQNYEWASFLEGRGRICWILVS